MERPCPEYGRALVETFEADLIENERAKPADEELRGRSGRAERRRTYDPEPAFITKAFRKRRKGLSVPFQTVDPETERLLTGISRMAATLRRKNGRAEQNTGCSWLVVVNYQQVLISNDKCSTT